MMQNNMSNSLSSFNGDQKKANAAGPQNFSFSKITGQSQGQSSTSTGTFSSSNLSNQQLKMNHPSNI